VGDKQQTRSGVESPLRHRPLLELATRQHGVVSTRQLSSIGYTRSSASKANGVGRLQRLHRGVYAVGHERLSWQGRCMAAVLACDPAVASHTSAAWLWGLTRTRPGTIHLTVPSRRHAKREFVVHFAGLREQDQDVVEEIPVTSVARTILDLAPMNSATGLERILERAEELKSLDLDALDELLARSVGHPGAGLLRRALDAYRPDPAFTRSKLERRFLALLKQAALPVPSMNFNVAGLELDAYWEAERFVVELDVYETHGSHAAFERDRLRQDELLLIGIEMIRVTGPRLKREPQATIARVAAHLERRRRELAERVRPL
jgi:predicted transcriptional regulator of viral defense system